MFILLAGAADRLTHLSAASSEFLQTGLFTSNEISILKKAEILFRVIEV